MKKLTVKEYVEQIYAAWDAYVAGKRNETTDDLSYAASAFSRTPGFYRDDVTADASKAYREAILWLEISREWTMKKRPDLAGPACKTAQVFFNLIDACE